ncbi:MAG TPA: DUF6504 family protein [Pedococcus sp.]|nr:DUF6504 family protein [Pedococcus sp.]
MTPDLTTTWGRVTDESHLCGSGPVIRRLDPALHRARAHIPLTHEGNPLVVRRYEEPIEVRQGVTGVTGVSPDNQPERPDAFVWRGRLYVVRAVLDQWQERRPWWRDAREGRDVLADARERRVWRVEASPGRLAGVGVYDLGATRPDPAGPSSTTPTGGQRSQWQLLRVAD